MSDNPLLTNRPRKTVPLYSGEVAAKIDEYDDQIEAAYAAESGTSRASGSEADRLAAERDEYAAKAREESLKVVLEAVTIRKREKLLGQHPARKGNRRDEQVGFNLDTYPAALIRAALVSPEVTDEQWEEFVDEVSSGRMDSLFETAFELSNGDVELPKLSAVTLLTRSREQESRRRGVLG